jgi:hypothetical protein
MELAVCVIARQKRHQLVEGSALGDPAVVPAEYLSIEIEGEHVPAQVLLDRRATPIVRNEAGSRGVFFVDAFRSVGFHCLEIENARYFFATEDGKLQLDGILAILKLIDREGLSWGQQLFFADGAAIRDPRVDFAWLMDVGPRIVATVNAIADRPWRRQDSRPVRGRPGPGNILIGPTMSMLRRNGRTGLDEAPGGPVEFRGRSYWPQAAVMERPTTSIDTVGNRRATALLVESHALAHHLLSSDDVPTDVKNQLQPLQGTIAKCCDRFPFNLLSGRPFRLKNDPSTEEMVDARYAETYRLYQHLNRDLAWEPGVHLEDEFAYVAYADQIYEAFCAVTIARAAGVPQVGSALRPYLSRPSFRSERYDFYYDTEPPTPEFRNWRKKSSRPAEMRPDLTLVDREARTGIFVDAKYRLEGSGRLPSSAIHDCQVYLQSFGRKHIAICYPAPRPQISEIAADGFRILEIGLGPYSNLLNYVSNDVWSALKGAMEPLGT